MKFLATQETDFLSHVFHLYDSDVEEEDDDEEETTERGSDRQSMISVGTSRAKTSKSKGTKRKTWLETWDGNESVPTGSTIRSTRACPVGTLGKQYKEEEQIEKP